MKVCGIPTSFPNKERTRTRTGTGGYESPMIPISLIRTYTYNNFDTPHQIRTGTLFQATGLESVESAYFSRGANIFTTIGICLGMTIWGKGK